MFNQKLTTNAECKPIYKGLHSAFINIVLCHLFSINTYYFHLHLSFLYLLNKVDQGQNILNPNNWIKTYSDELFGYAMNKTGHSGLAEDLVQETFLAGLKSQSNFKGHSSERTWLFSILKFKIADHYRKASTKYEISNSKLGNEDDSYIDNYFTEDGDWKENAAPKNWGSDHSFTIENKELGSALNGCIDKLPDNQKQLILLKLVEEEETEIVCKELNITPTNYWVIIHRAKLQLRACLEKNWFKA